MCCIHAACMLLPPSPQQKACLHAGDDILAVCLTSNFHATKAAVPHMLKAGWGRIINTGSMHALVASPYKSEHGAATGAAAAACVRVHACACLLVDGMAVARCHGGGVHAWCAAQVPARPRAR